MVPGLWIYFENGSWTWIYLKNGPFARDENALLWSFGGFGKFGLFTLLTF